MPKKALSLKIQDLVNIKASLELLILSKELGVNNSLLLHRNIKEVKRITEDYDQSVDVINKVCYKTNNENQLIYTDEGRLEILPGKMTELKASITSLNNKVYDVELEVMNVEKLPEKLGSFNGSEIFHAVPALYDYVLVTPEEYKDLGV